MDLFRHIPNRVELFLNEFLRAHICQLRSLPDRRLAQVQDPVWFFSEYSKERNKLAGLIKSDLGISDLYSRSLLSIYNVDKVVFKHQDLLRTKLLLKDYPQFAEFPILKEIQVVREELDLPYGTIVNKCARLSGLYLMDSEDIEIKDSSKKLYLYGVFDIGSGIEIKKRFELDFVMSFKPYGTSCRNAYDRLIIKPMINFAEKMFKKNYSSMHKLACPLLKSNANKFISDIPTGLLTHYLPTIPHI